MTLRRNEAAMNVMMVWHRGGPEPPVDPPDPCGTGQCDGGDCCGQRDADDQYDQWVDMNIEEKENDDAGE